MEVVLQQRRQSQASQQELQQEIELQKAQLQRLEAKLQGRVLQGRLSTRWTAVASELVLTVPRGSSGELAIVNLQNYGPDLGCQYQESLSGRLRGLASGSALS